MLLQQALAYQSSMFSRAQALRRDGCAPPAWGVPDDLPTRMAYQQLNTLAGMAGKVSRADLFAVERWLGHGQAMLLLEA